MKATIRPCSQRRALAAGRVVVATLPAVASNAATAVVVVARARFASVSKACPAGSNGGMGTHALRREAWRIPYPRYAGWVTASAKIHSWPGPRTIVSTAWKCVSVPV